MGEITPTGPKERVYLGLGSNLGDRAANLANALELIGQSVALDTSSALYDTDPWGYVEQPSFLNCACGGWTTLNPRALLRAVKEVERALGREPTFPNGPRVLDVDILFYGQRVIREPGLEIPHPRLAERAFVLVPLAEIAPQVLHPVLNLTVGELLRTVAGDRSSGGLPEGVRHWGVPLSLLNLTQTTFGVEQ